MKNFFFGVNLIRSAIKILILEDDSEFLSYIGKLLEESCNLLDLKNYSILHKAIDESVNENFDVILLDLNLEESTGINSLQKVIDNFPNIPIIVISGVNSNLAAINSVKYGAEDFLFKNQINIHILRRSIEYSIERFRLKQQLRESEKKSAQIIENITEAVVILDFDGKTLYASPQLNKILECSESNNGLNLFDYIYNKDIKIFNNIYSKKKIDDQDEGFISSEFRVCKKDGNYIWLSTLSRNYYDRKGKYIGVILSIRNITELKQLYNLILKTPNRLIMDEGRLISSWGITYSLNLRGINYHPERSYLTAMWKFHSVRDAEKLVQFAPFLIKRKQMILRG